MDAIPIQIKDHSNDALFLILSRDDMLKMKDGIPMQLDMKEMAKKTGKRTHQPTIIVCYEDDPIPVMQFLQKGDIIGALRHLQRGLTRKKDDPIQAMIEKGIGG